MRPCNSRSWCWSPIGVEARWCMSMLLLLLLKWMSLGTDLPLNTAVARLWFRSEVNGSSLGAYEEVGTVRVLLRPLYLTRSSNCSWVGENLRKCNCWWWAIEVKSSHLKLGRRVNLCFNFSMSSGAGEDSRIERVRTRVNCCVAIDILLDYCSLEPRRPM